LIEAVEEIPQRAEQADMKAARPERGQVDGNVGLPEFLAERQPEEARRENGDITMESQKGAEGRDNWLSYATC